MAKKQGLVIGPQKRLLSEFRKPGPLPDLAPRIASLVIAQWIDKQPKRLEPTAWACDLYTSLSGRKLSPATFARYKKTAEAEICSVWSGSDEKRIPAITQLLAFLQSRYRRFQQDGYPLDEARKQPGILYSIDFFEPVLRAAGVDVKGM